MADDEYVLGTHAAEVERLALQHRVWRQHVLETWQRAGLARGQTVLDIGCGTGNASFDLAELVGPEGLVVAVDQSRRFLDDLAAGMRDRHVHNVRTFQLDLDREPLPAVSIDFAWNRWVMSFLRQPRTLLERVAARLKPNGVFVIHEYFDYATWRTAPPSEEIDVFVAAVMRTWRDSGGEPDLGRELPVWLDETGFDVRDVRPIIAAAEPGSPPWRWLAAFIESGRHRLETLSAITPQQSAAVGAALARLARDPRTRMMTPALLEIVAVKR